MFRFSIRELMLLTLVVAMGVAWFAEHRSVDKKVYHVIEILNQEHKKEIDLFNEELESHGLEIQAIGYHGRHVINKQSPSSVGQP